MPIWSCPREHQRICCLLKVEWIALYHDMFVHLSLESLICTFDTRVSKFWAVCLWFFGLSAAPARIIRVNSYSGKLRLVFSFYLQLLDKVCCLPLHMQQAERRQRLELDISEKFSSNLTKTTNKSSRTASSGRAPNSRHNDCHSCQHEDKDASCEQHSLVSVPFDRSN